MVREGSANDPPTTHWSIIERLADPGSHESWAWLVERYRPAIRQTIRAVLGARAPDVEIEGFWTYLFESQAMARAQRGRSFRKYLRGIARNYALQRLESRHVGLPIDTALLPTFESTFSQAEESAWAKRIVELALERVESDHAEHGTILREFYGIATAQKSAAQIAADSGKNANTLHQALYRARLRFRAALESEVRETVSDASNLQAEVLAVLATLDQRHPGLAEVER